MPSVTRSQSNKLQPILRKVAQDPILAANLREALASAESEVASPPLMMQKQRRRASLHPYGKKHSPRVAMGTETSITINGVVGPPTPVTLSPSPEPQLPQESSPPPNPIKREAAFIQAITTHKGRPSQGYLIGTAPIGGHSVEFWLNAEFAEALQTFHMHTSIV